MRVLFYILSSLVLFVSCKSDCDCFRLLADNADLRDSRGAITIDTLNWKIGLNDGFSYCDYKKKTMEECPKLGSVRVHFESSSDGYVLISEDVSYIIAKNVECNNPDLNGDYHEFEITHDYKDDKWDKYAYGTYCFSPKFEHDSTVYFPFWQRYMCMLGDLGIKNIDLPRLAVECDRPLIGSDYILKENYKKF